MQGMKQAAEIEFLGGSIVGGIAYLNNREIGRWNGGDFYLEPGNEQIIADARAAKKQRDEQQAAASAAVAEAAAPVKAPAPTPAKAPATKPAQVDPDAPTPADAELQAQLDALGKSTEPKK